MTGPSMNIMGYASQEEAQLMAITSPAQNINSGRLNDSSISAVAKGLEVVIYECCHRFVLLLHIRGGRVYWYEHHAALVNGMRLSNYHIHDRLGVKKLIMVDL